MSVENRDVLKEADQEGNRQGFRLIIY